MCWLVVFTGQLGTKYAQILYLVGKKWQSPSIMQVKIQLTEQAKRKLAVHPVGFEPSSRQKIGDQAASGGVRTHAVLLLSQLECDPLDRSGTDAMCSSYGWAHSERLYTHLSGQIRENN